MSWDEVKGQWKQLKGKVKQQWGKLTDDDLDVIDGKKDQLMGKIPGGKPATDAGYVDGSQGILTSSDGNKMD